MIIKCANCLNEAIFAYQVTGSYSIKYCSRHIPKFLNSPKYTGRLVKMSDLKAPVVEEAPTKSSKKKATTPEPEVVEEPTVVEEEVVVDEPTSEEPPVEVTEAE